MNDEQSMMWCGKELERLAMQPYTVVNVIIEGGDGDEQESVPTETGVSPAESGTSLDVGNTD